MLKHTTLLLLTLVLLSCSSEKKHPTKPETTGFASRIGKQITIVGRAENRKAGSVLVTREGEFWLTDQEWSDEILKGKHSAENVVVTGILGEDNASPVFIPKEGEPPVQGIPVPEGTDLKKASHRWTITKATVKALK